MRNQLEDTVRGGMVRNEEILEIPEDVTILMENLNKCKQILERDGHNIDDDSGSLLGNIHYLGIRMGQALFVEGKLDKEQFYRELSQEGVVDKERFYFAYSKIESYVKAGIDITKKRPKKVKTLRGMPPIVLPKDKPTVLELITDKHAEYGARVITTADNRKPIEKIADKYKWDIATELLEKGRVSVEGAYLFFIQRDESVHPTAFRHAINVISAYCNLDEKRAKELRVRI